MNLSTSEGRNGSGESNQAPCSSILDIDAVNGAIDILQRPAEKSKEVILALGSVIKRVIEIPKDLKEVVRYYREN